MHKTLFNKLLAEWGASKIAQVFIGICVGGSFSGLLLAMLIPNEPTQIKENENE